MLQYLQEWNPFSLDPSLRSISTGVHAHSTVDGAVAVGDMILNVTTPTEYAFQKKIQAVTLGSKSFSVKTDEDRIQIDPLFLFQRLTTVMQLSDNLELSFNKPALADATWKICESSVPVVDIPDNGIQYVPDGGALLQRIPWSHGSTYGDICQQYTEYVVRKYKDAIFVFDGCENINTKCMTHQRISKGKASTTVTVAANMTTTIKKDQFMANKKNKQQFIFLLSAELEKNSCNTYHATGGADLLPLVKLC